MNLGNKAVFQWDIIKPYVIIICTKVLVGSCPMKTLSLETIDRARNIKIRTSQSWSFACMCMIM